MNELKSDLTQECRRRKASGDAVRDCENGDRVYDLNLAQQDIYFDLVRRHRALYHVGAQIDIVGPLDESVLQMAYDRMWRESEILRSTITLRDYQPYITVLWPSEKGRAAPKIRLVDLEGRRMPQDRWDALVREHFAIPFALDGRTLLHELTLFRIERDRHYLVFKCHHILIDGRTGLNMFKRLVETYDAIRGQRVEMLPPSMDRGWKSGADCNYLGSIRCDRDAKYWATELADLPPPLLETLGNDNVPQSERFGLQLDRDEYLELCQCAERRGLWPATLFQGVFHILLSRLTGQADFCVGTPVLNRHNASERAAYGLFVRLAPIRAKVDKASTVIDFLKELQAKVRSAYRHQGYPLSRMVADTKVLAQRGRRLFDAVFSYEKDAEIAGFDACRIELTPLTHEGERYPISLHVRDLGDDGPVALHFDYQGEFWGAYGVEPLSRQYLEVLRGVDGGMDAAMADLTISREQFDHQFIAALNATKHEMRQWPDHVIGLFDEQVKKAPNRIAVCDSKESLSYRELNKRVNQLARVIQQKCSELPPESRIGIMLERSNRFMASVLAVLKLGCAYVPIDRRFPEARIQFILEDSGARLLLTEDESERAGQIATCGQLNVERGWQEIAKESEGPLDCKIVPTSLAYVLYTSGTTGKPKGVLVEQKSLVNRLAWQWEALALTEADVFLQKTTCTFDVSVWEILMPICFGARVVMCPADVAYEQQALSALIEREKVTCIHFVPSVLNMLMGMFTADSASKWRSVRWIVTSGEVLSASTARTVYTWLPRTKIMNLYGPTEATIDVSYYAVERNDEIVYIGRPVWNTQLYVLDREGRSASVGSVGELYIGGVQVARGYLNRPELNEERFVEHPEGAHLGRLYRTGDLARLSRTGNIEYLGRIDNQVKINGIRIELDEITKNLLDYPDIREATVQVPDTGTDSDVKSVVLVGYFAAKAGIVDVAELRGYLAQRLPEYMVPSKFVQLDHLPLNANGKLDTRRLAKEVGRVVANVTMTPAAPRDLAERRMIRVWEKVLNVQPIGIDDNFFAIGGQSLLALKTMQLLRREIGCDLSLRDIFNNPTVRQLAEHLRTTKSGEPDILIRLAHSDAASSNIFFIPPVSGSSTVYHELALRLSSRARGFGCQYDDTRAQSLLQISRTFSSAIQRVQPNGPYCLVGYSMGAKIAYEIAKLLELAGERTSLVLLDGGPNGQGSFDLGRAHLEIQQGIERVMAITAQGTQEALPSESTYLRDVVLHNMKLDASHECQGQIEGRVIVVRALKNERPLGLQQWRALTRGAFEMIELDCGHFELLSEHAVDRVVQYIEKVVETAVEYQPSASEDIPWASSYSKSS